MMYSARNRFTGAVARIHITPINGAHIVKVDGSTVELHRGSAITAERYVMRMVDDGTIWEAVTI